MDPKLLPLIAELEMLKGAFLAHVPAGQPPFNVAHANWTFPPLVLQNIITLIDWNIKQLSTVEAVDISVTQEIVDRLIAGITYMRSTLPQNTWGNSQIAFSTLSVTLDFLRRIFIPSPPVLKPIEEYEELQKEYGSALARTRVFEKRLNALAPKSDRLEQYLARIEEAYAAADKLPTDLEELADAQAAVRRISEQSTRMHAGVEDSLNQSKKFLEEIKELSKQAAKAVEDVHSAYAAATSQGLASAFSERSKGLEQSMRFWVGGFIGALTIGGFFGVTHLNQLAELLSKPNVAPATLWLNLLLSVLSVAAPSWFAWMAAKSIGHRFRLAEDYAFKAAISRAYEGYRRETVRVGDGLEAKLLRSALDRLEEQPLRFVDVANHASPLHELASSDLAKGVLNTVGDAVSATKSLAVKIAEKPKSDGQSGAGG